jgi:hypothetical protein
MPTLQEKLNALREKARANAAAQVPVQVLAPNEPVDRKDAVPVEVSSGAVQAVEFDASPLGELQAKLHELREMLLTEHPQIPRLLQVIHKTMQEQGDLVIQLTDEEIGVFIQALKNHMNVTVVSEKAKKATSTASLKKASASDMGLGDLAALAASMGISM